MVGAGMPRVSVLIPVYNREKVIAETIASVLGQTFADFELIICDDCSADGSVGIVKSFADPRIRLIRNEINQGSSASRNRLIGEARGEFCALLDSDDIALPHRLETQVGFLDARPDVDACSGALIIIDGDGRENGRVWYKETAGHEALKVKTLFKCAVAQTALMFRRREFIEAGLAYVPGPANDLGLFKHALHKLRFANIGTPLVKYRVWQSQMSTEHDNQRERALEHLYYQYDLLGLTLTDDDRDVLRVVVTGGRIPPELADGFADLAARIAGANKQKQVFSQAALVSCMLSMYKGTMRLARKKGLGAYFRFRCKYRRFRKILAGI